MAGRLPFPLSARLYSLLSALPGRLRLSLFDPLQTLSAYLAVLVQIRCALPDQHFLDSA